MKRAKECQTPRTVCCVLVALQALCHAGDCRCRMPPLHWLKSAVAHIWSSEQVQACPLPEWMLLQHCCQDQRFGHPSSCFLCLIFLGAPWEDPDRP